MEEIFLSKSKEITQEFAQNFAEKLQGGDVVLLYGNLGAGKTTFVQGLAKGLGITHRIISPTFIILRTYQIHTLSSRAKSRDLTKEGSKNSVSGISPRTSFGRNDNGARKFYHVDLYRLENEKDVESIGLLDLMGRKENIVVIEWPEKLGSLLPENVWKIYFENKEEDKRSITIEKAPSVIPAKAGI